MTDRPEAAGEMRDPHEVLNAELSEQYALEDELGRGGMASVFLAHDRKHDRRVAIKVIHPELLQGTGPRRFEQEIRITAGLRHPHILPLLDSGVAGELLFYVTPYVEGETLQDRLRRDGRLPIDEAVLIAADVAAALEHAHRQEIVHRDIKPANILLSEGHAIVADFGLARAFQSAGDATLTAEGTVMGTVAYISPEQATGVRDVDGRTDVYSLGCVLYEMVAGRPPFVAKPPEKLLKLHMFKQPAPLASLRDGVPPALDRATMQALEKSPANRQPSASAFLSALQAYDREPTGPLAWLRRLFAPPASR